MRLGKEASRRKEKAPHLKVSGVLPGSHRHRGPSGDGRRRSVASTPISQA